MAGPKLPDINSIISAGFNPRTGLPYKFGGNPETLKQDILKLLRVVDQQDAVNRFVWYNLPDGLDGELIERILYYKGQGAMVFHKPTEKFYFLPYCLNGTIDCYGRYTGISVLPFNGSTEEKKQDKLFGNQVFKPRYAMLLDDTTEDDFVSSAVLLHDYTKQISQTTIPRQLLNDPLLAVMAECVPFMRTSMLIGTGIKGYRVNDADQAEQVEAASKSVENSALTGKPWISIIGGIEFQDLGNPSNLKGADYMQAMQSLDNLRLSTYGIENGGLFEKQAHLLETEAAINGGSVGLVYQDSLRIRQNFANICNSIWGTSIWVEPSEAVMGGDVNHDGVGYDISDPATQGGEVNGDDSTI